MREGDKGHPAQRLVLLESLSLGWMIQEACCCQPHAPHGSGVGVKSEDKIHGPSQPLTSWVMQETGLTFLGASEVPSGKCGCHEQFPPSHLSKNYVGVSEISL